MGRPPRVAVRLEGEEEAVNPADLRARVAEALYQAHYTRPEGRTVRDEPANVEWDYHRLAIDAIKIVVEACGHEIADYVTERERSGATSFDERFREGLCAARDLIRALGKAGA